MAGNSQRRGAMRAPGSKKGPTAGSGGQRRRGLEPKKPTPKAVDREKHPAAKRAKAAEKRAATPRPTSRPDGATSRASKPSANSRSSESTWSASKPPRSTADGGSRPTTGGSRSTTGGSRPTTGGSRSTTGGSRPTTGGSRSATGGSRSATGGSRPTTGGSRSSAGGSRSSAGGSRPTSGGSRSTSGGSRPAAGGQRPSVRASGRPETNEQVYGRNSVVEALRAGVPSNVLHVQADLALDDRIREALELAAERRLPVMEMTRFEMDRMTSHGVHQGLSLTVPPYQYLDPSVLLEIASNTRAASLFVALDGITDPRNLGAVVRSAAAFGAKGILIPERRAAGMGASAWKTSAGAAARVPVSRITNMTRTLLAFRDVGATVIGLAAEGPTSIDQLDSSTMSGAVVVVVGSEGEGLGRLVAKTCDLLVSIPIMSSTESLNAGVAASIALYEIDRLRRTSQS